MKTAALGLLLALLSGCPQSTNSATEGLMPDAGPDSVTPSVIACDDLDYEWPANHARTEEVLFSESAYPTVPATFFEERMGFIAPVPASELTLMGQTLVADLRWDGNCRDHHFELHWIRSETEMGELHAYLELSDAALGCPDTCEGSSEYSASFDLSAVISVGERENASQVWVHVNEQPPQLLQIAP